MAASPPDARLFVGILVPETLHASLLDQRQTVAGTWRWTPPGQWHVTLRFLGDVARGRLPELIDALSPLQAQAPPTLTLGGWGGFPDSRRAVTLVRHVELTPDLEALWQATARQTAPWLARPESRSFRPHVTFGRCRRPQPVPLTATEPLDWLATEVHLIESRLSPTGATYAVRATVTLGGGP